MLDIGSLFNCSQILQAQYDRDAKARDLWACILDTIDFMNHAEPLKVIQHLSKTTQAIMEQLRECIIFLTEYGKKSMTGGLVIVLSKIIQPYSASRKYCASSLSSKG